MIDLPALRTEIETVTGLTIAGGGRDGSELWVEFETTEGVDDIALAETVREAVAAHTPQEITDLDLLVAKARNVWAGTDTFTAAQSQKILAGLVLVVARHLR
jgi:hypothetical protein